MVHIQRPASGRDTAETAIHAAAATRANLRIFGTNVKEWAAALRDAGWSVDPPGAPDVVLAVDVPPPQVVTRRPIAPIVYVARGATEAPYGADFYLHDPTREALIQTCERALRLARLRAASVDRTSDLIESMGEAYFALDRYHCVTQQNRRARALIATLEASSGDIVGELLRDHLPKEIDGRISVAIEHAMRHSEHQLISGCVITSGRWIDVHIAPTPEGAALYVRDVTARKGLEDDLTAAREALAKSEKLATLGSLVSGVAHEVRTPLAYIQNNHQLIERSLQRAAEAGTSAREALDSVSPHFREIEDGIGRIQRIVKDLARFTRLEAGVWTEVDLYRATTQALELFRVTQKSGIAVLVDLAPTPRVEGDGSQIQQIVLNLLSNAVEATRAGGNVRASTGRAPDGRAFVSIADEGEGISPPALQRIYDPLFTTKQNGSGLGLSIVKRIVDEHRAEILLETGAEGTCFTILFPEPRETR